MMPPVSLPWKGGTVSARAGAKASIPTETTRLAAHIIRIADSSFVAATLKRIDGRGKNGGGPGCRVTNKCCRVALDLARASRHRPAVGSFPRITHARPVQTSEKA